jgi:hypothetical protein
VNTEEQVDYILEGYHHQLRWVEELLQGKSNDDMFISEASAGRHFAMLINEVCDFNIRRARTVIDLKPWIGDEVK